MKTKPTKNAVDHYGNRICQSLRRSAGSLSQAGKYLLAAKDQPERGPWIALLDEKLIGLGKHEASGCCRSNRGRGAKI
jgi:hypothetical protein